MERDVNSRGALFCFLFFPNTSIVTNKPIRIRIHWSFWDWGWRVLTVAKAIKKKDGVSPLPASWQNRSMKEHAGDPRLHLGPRTGWTPQKNPLPYATVRSAWSKPPHIELLADEAASCTSGAPSALKPGPPEPEPRPRPSRPHIHGHVAHCVAGGCDAGQRGDAGHRPVHANHRRAKRSWVLWQHTGECGSRSRRPQSCCSQSVLATGIGDALVRKPW